MTRTRHKTKVPGIYYREDAQGVRRYIVWHKGSTKTLPPGSTLEDAKDFQADLRGGGKVISRRIKAVSLFELWYERRVHEGASRNTLNTYLFARRNAVHISDLYIGDLTANDIALMISKLEQRGLKGNSIRNVVSFVSGACKYAVREGWMSTNPCDALLRGERPKRDQKEIRILTSEEIELLLEKAPKRWRPLFATLVFTGLRINEALDLTWDDVDLEENLIHVRRSKTEAGVRSVVLFPALRRLLTALRLESDPGVPFVFTTAEKGRGHRNYTLRVLKRILPDITQHELRHTFASLLIGQGMDVTFVCDQMGHANPAITLKLYAKLFDPKARRDEARERLQAAFGGLV